MTADEVGKNSFAKKEEQVLKFWKDNQIFEKSLQNRQGKTLYSFYDGPPFATGLPHYGHLLASTIKDVVGRYATMDGYYVPRRFGWDCHGVPVEYEVEKSLSLTAPGAIEDFGIASFNEECRKIVFRYVHEWEYYINRIGRWVDFSSTWKTMDASFMESVWWVFQSLYNQGLVYEGTKVVPFSTALGTPLSNFEASQNYKEVDDPSLVVRMPLQNDSASLLVWTTTPWTLPSNMAIAVGEALVYVRIQDKKSGEQWILSQGCVSRWFSNPEEFVILESFSGKDLVGRTYEPPFTFFQSKREEGAFRVIAASFVEESEGTGVVHMAPAFGEGDFLVCKENHVPLVCPVDAHGSFTEEIPQYQGQYIKHADKEIIKFLKKEGRIFYHGTVKHRYPFCWRTDTPLIYKAVNSWFVAVEKIKDKMLRANSSIHWVPEHIQEGRFGKWLEGARDWAISRNRYWGTPIPIWKSADGEILVVGSIRELEELTGTQITDIHRHFIDDLNIVKDGKPFHRIPYVFDCWFDSGAMPYAQNHYPFENQKETEEAFPADFIAEGLDQTRGWFYTLTVISAILFDRPAFRNAIVNGIILAEDGNKMSKRLNNYPSPKYVLDTYGADALRLYLLHSVVVKAEDLRFSDKGIEGVLKQILLPLTSVLSFFNTYAELYGFDPKSQDIEPAYTEIDQWILSNLYSVVGKVRESMSQYHLNFAVEPFVTFIDDLTNWYIRRCRRRFWEAENTPDRRAAFSTLYEVLTVFCKVIAPFVPFLAEDIYQKLKLEKEPESVHLCDFPQVEMDKILPDLEKRMHDIREIVGLGHSLRKEHKLKVRQPLANFYVVGSKDRLSLLKTFEGLIAEELNVKNVIFYEEAPSFIYTTVKPNFRMLGKKVGSKMKEVQKALSELPNNAIDKLIQGETWVLTIDDREIALDGDDVVICRHTDPGYIARSSALFSVILDCQLTEPLIVEGIARELVNKINTMRRNQQLHVSDRIALRIKTTEAVHRAFLDYENYICEETLIIAYDFTQNSDFQGEDWDINGHATQIEITVSSIDS
ncbi:isoleucyl-tRNA synthetase [Chlamydia pneumoniae LPCoLN]|uniref:isoleucine--tRNA ligase n=1 Tax=Chlamydia pneumoniae TaxID=83558 RepID=UPI0001BD9DAF|nr:isoleucine--tRNA ligase [Chlamydia pneumoniae]ACZ33089.1 isoleucyl-tRNA synthetase [Chlamydia pneumoniae LPCoLN]ETR79993.1 Isoleucyl-tRNA synthetase [Chlamydia pneumoniae B21]